VSGDYDLADSWQSLKDSIVLGRCDLSTL